MDERYLHLLSHGVFLSLMVMINYTMFQILDFLLLKKSSKYKNIQFHHKRYVVKNLTKSFILFLLLVISMRGVYELLFLGYWDNYLIYTVGTIYLSTDLSGLLFVPKLPKETVIHHCSVVVLSIVNLFMDYSVNGLHRAILALAVLSMIPYLVNTYLGIRHLENNTIQKRIVKICLFLYSVSILLNIIIQHLYIFWLVPTMDIGMIIKKVIYFMIYYCILYDDIKLVKYLYYKYNLNQ